MKVVEEVCCEFAEHGVKQVASIQKAVANAFGKNNGGIGRRKKTGMRLWCISFATGGDSFNEALLESNRM